MANEFRNFGLPLESLEKLITELTELEGVL